MKRTILIILCLVCFVTTFLVVRGEMAANQKIWDSKTGLDGILLEDGTVEITHYWNNDSLLLYIPSTLCGYPVSRIGDKAIAYNTKLIDISIPEGVTSIGNEAFTYCIEVTSIKLPSTITEIGTSAFANCSKLKKMSIPEGVEVLPDGLFSDCKSLNAVSIPKGVTAIGDSAFSGCSLKEITIPESVLCIGDEAFSGCGLKNITISDGVVSIGNSAFADNAFDKITLPDSVTTIGDSAFANCPNLTTIRIPDSVVSIGTNPFNSCKKLSSIAVSPNHSVLAVIDNVLYEKETKTLICYPQGKPRDSFIIPRGIKRIGAYAFSGCSMAEIVFPETLVEICKSAFSGASISNDTLTFTANITSIGQTAFYGCSWTKLKSITLPAGVEVGANAFSNNIALTSVIIEGDAVLDRAVFDRCANLKSVLFGDGKVSLNGNPFTSCDKLSAIEVSPNHSNLISENGVLIDQISHTLVCYPAGKKDADYTVPQGIERIGEDAFTHCEFLRNITLPEGTIEICSRAFTLCNRINSFIFPSSVRVIGKNAFNLTKVASFTVNEGSFAEQYCIEEELNFTYANSLDWLND